PQKTEIRFTNEGLIFATVKRAINAALEKAAAEKTNFSTSFSTEPVKVYALKSINSNQFNEQKEIRFVGNGAVYSSEYQSKKKYETPDVIDSAIALKVSEKNEDRFFNSTF